MVNHRSAGHRTRQWSAGAGLAGGAMVAAMLGAGAPAARADDLLTDIGLAATTGNQYDPAIFDYSTDPSNLFSPAYTIAPVGPENVEVTTDATGAVYGTQEFSASSLGIPIDTFTGNVEYTPLTGTGLSFISSELGGYSETITTLGTPGTLLPENTAFLVDEFGLGYGNVFEESMNSAGTSATVGDYILTPFGDRNITPTVDLFLPQGIGINDLTAGAAAEPLAAASSAGSTPDDVIGQAIADLNQGTAVLDAAPTADLSARQAETLADSINVNTELDSPLAQMATLQDGFSAADQTYLTNADEQLVTAAANMLSADQGFVTADQAGDLSGSSFNSTDLTLLEGTLGLLNADLNVGGAELVALFTGGLDPASAADLASSIDPGTAVDPSVFADLLSSIGL